MPRRSTSAFWLALWLAVLLVPASRAQDAFLARWETVRGGQPAKVDLQIGVPKATFYLGELIPLTLTFTAAELRSFLADSRTGDRIGRLNDTEAFVIDPAGLAEDPLRGLQGETGGMGGISGGNAILSPEEPFVIERNLNEWVRFRGPGIYRLYVLSRRVRQAPAEKLTDLDLRTFARSKPVELVSNVLTLEIVPAPPEWVLAQTAKAVGILDGPEGNEEKATLARRQAGLTLRFLDTMESVTALAERLSGENTLRSFDMQSGILSSKHKRELLPVMERLLTVPEQPISRYFLDTLSRLAVLVELGGVLPPYPAHEAAREAWEAESRRRLALFNKKMERYAELLLGSLPKKEEAARISSRDALIIEGESLPRRPLWWNGLVESLIADFPALPARMQSDLLSFRWRLLRNRDVLPLLNALYEKPPQASASSPPIHELALRRIYELNPERGRQLILNALFDENRAGIGDETLMMLPDETLPELNERFATQLAGGGPLPTRLITRYATGAIVKRVEAAYVAFEARLHSRDLHQCPFPLVFYFLKFDPDFGEKELRKTFDAGRCLNMAAGLAPLGRHAMSPALERLAIEYLASPIVPIKKGAAELLGKYGTPAARKPLWETMEYFREWWKDRESELQTRAGWESQLFERTLRTALAQAGGWVLGKEELARLLALCSSGDCRASVSQWIQDAATPVLVEFIPLGDGMAVKVAQYVMTDDLELARKLDQFPANAEFRFASSRSEEAASTRAKVEAAILASGRRIAP